MTGLFTMTTRHMKIFAIVILVVCCIVENASADWRDDVKINHMKHINSIINDTLAQIQRDANAKGTASAMRCLEDARLSLRTASSVGYSGVSNCVGQAKTAGEANVCAQKVDADVFNQSLRISSNARSCINRGY